MISIRRRLFLTLGLGAAGIIALAGLLLDKSLRSELSRRQDDALLSRAYALANALRADDGVIEVEGDYGFDTLGHRWMPELAYTVRRVDKSVVTHSSNQKAASLPDLEPLPNEPMFRSWQFSDRIPARLVAIQIDVPIEVSGTGESPEAQPNLSADGSSVVPEPEKSETMFIVMAQDSRELAATIAGFRRGYAVVAGLTLVFGAGLIAWTLHRGLKPLDALGRRVAEIGPLSLRSGLGYEPLPRELEPIRRRFDELLLRVHAAFERERRFQSAVAHELRTPIAELRTTVEVEMLEPHAAGHVQSLQTIAAVTGRMQSLVEALLLLRSVDARSDTPPLTPVRLRSVVQAVISESIEPARRRGIVFELPEGDHVEVSAHPELLKIAIRNLIANAVAHSPEQSRVGIVITGTSDRAELEIENPAPNLHTDDLPHLFEPFWRKDPSRTGSNHAGLGLSITQAVMDCMHMSVTVTLTDDKLFTARLRVPGVVRDTPT